MFAEVAVERSGKIYYIGMSWRWSIIADNYHVDCMHAKAVEIRLTVGRF
jgi:hypothetical protein